MRRWSTLLIMVAAMALAACHTVEGIGKDIQAGGKAVEKAAK
jgi:entericidin B